MAEEAPGTLQVGEPHPASHGAFRWLKRLGYEEMLLLQESFASSALDGSRPCEVCAETMRRVVEKESVSDRYLLGLAWTVRAMRDESESEMWRRRWEQAECELIQHRERQRRRHEDLGMLLTTPGERWWERVLANVGRKLLRWSHQ